MPKLAFPSLMPRRRHTSIDGDGGVSALFGPDSVQIAANHVQLNDGYAASFAIIGYPSEVGAGWLEPLLCYPGRLDVSVHVEPVPPQVAADRLRKQLGRLESGRQADAARGKLENFAVDAAAEDARDMAAALARGEGRLFRVGLYLTVHAASEEDLETEVGQVRALTASLLLDAAPASFRQLQGWTTTLPLAVDVLGMRRTMDTPALSAAFPFTSPDLPTSEVGPWAQPSGILYGVNASSSGLVIWDRWAQDNHNTVVLARSGAGKSYLTKLDTLRSLYQGVEVAIIDPEDEYRRLCEAVGGAYLNLGAPGVRLNPFDLPAGAEHTSDAVTRRALFLHTLIAVMLGEAINPAGRAALDRAIMAAYNTKGITSDARTWRRPAPVLADLAAALHEDDDPAAADLAARLAPFVSGSWKGLFDGETTTRPDSHLIVFSLRDLPDELKPLGTLLTLDTVWRRISNPADRRQRLVVVDEAWLLMKDPEGAKFLFRLAKAARKQWAGLTVITQDAADVLGSELGQAVIANSATQILLRQAPQAIDLIAHTFRLSDGERAYLLSAERGSGLLAGGANARVAFHAIASDHEHVLATTNPAELAELEHPDSAEDEGLEP